jgi:uncharacterized membrane protein YfcA
MESWQFFLALGGASFGAGAFGAMLGLGGGVILVPVMTLLLGIDIRYAIGASIVSVIATSSGAAATYVRDHITNMRIGMFLETGTTAGAITGALIGGLISGRALYVIFGVVVAYSAYMMFRKRNQELPANTEPDALARRLRLSGSYYDVALGQTVAYHPTHTLSVLGLTYIAGIVSGLLGIGGGALKVPAMDIAMKLPIKVSSATSNFMIGVTAAASAGVYFVRGQINPAIAAPVALGVLCGAMVGTRLMIHARSKVLRLVFAGLLAVLTVQMLYRGLA